MKAFLHIIAPLLLFCIGARAEEITLPSKATSLLIGNMAEVFEDTSGNLDITQVSSAAFQQQFSRSDQKIFNFPNKSSTYWIKLKITKRFTEQQLVLEVAQPLLNEIYLYKTDSEDKFVAVPSGYKVKITDKLFKNHLQVFSLNSVNNTYYLRVLPTNFPIPVKVWEQNAFESKTVKQHFSEGILLGVLLFVILINVFLFISTRKFTYLHYSFLVAMYAFFIAIFEGYIVYFFPNIDLDFWYFLNPIINQANGLAFCILFLEVKKYRPKLFKFAIALLIYFTSYIFWYHYLAEGQRFQLNQLHALVGILFMASLGIAVGLKKNPLGYYFSLAYIIFFIIAAVEVLYMTTGSPSYILFMSHVSFGIFIEVCILALLLTKRFQWDKEYADKERKQAQQLLLEKTLENERIITEQNTLLEKRVALRTEELHNSLANLKLTQAKLIQNEKLASLGELTAGIAHEIQNPLNFVNNFSEVSNELLEELKEELDKGEIDEAKAISDDVIQNLEKISYHGHRASSIVKGMLEHSRARTDEKEQTDITVLADEYLRLAYHGLRAKDRTFNANFNTDFEENIPSILTFKQDIGRVLLNIINNAFQAVAEKQRIMKSSMSQEVYKPEVVVKIFKTQQTIEVKISDNGMGVRPEIKDKIFQPFYTTKSTGEGTGLGLSLAYDIITKGHDGTLTFDSEHMVGSTFSISLPL